MPSNLLGETCGKLAGFVDVIPADILPHDGAEVGEAYTVGLTSRSPDPKGNHYVTGEQGDEADTDIIVRKQLHRRLDAG